MTKQKTAALLAEHVLGGKFYPQNVTGNSMLWNIGERFLKPSQLSPFIYSPDGFFAVLKAFKKFPLHLKEQNALIRAWDYFYVDQDYDAFYNAVLKALGVI